MNKILLFHPTGNANVRAAALGLNKAGMLEEFHTSIAVFPQDHLFKLSKLKGPFAEIGRRSFDPSLRNLTFTSPFWETGRLISAKIGLSSLIKHEEGIFCIDAVYRHIDRMVSKKLRKKKSVNAVYAYEDGALHSFEIAKQYGISCFYELPIGYWRAAKRLMEPELEKWPDWADTFIGFKDSTDKLSRKDKELSLADRIIVASSFTAKTLREYPGQLSKIDIIPYGFPSIGDLKKYTFQHKPLKVLFVGGLSQRKGIAYLLEASDRLGDAVELTIVGQKSVENCRPLNVALSKHKWIPSLPHNEILKVMKEHDVLVFPSLYEGFGLVITEAMAQGTPVITTDRTAGPDLIEHGHNGWIIDAGSTEAIIEVLEELLINPKQIAKAGKNAMETARKRPWSVYGQELAEILR